MLRASESSDLPAMIVTDLSMPRMTGLELLRALKSDARTRSIPVAVITSSNVPNDRELALQAGACSFVHKPFGIDALTRILIEIRESCGELAAPSSAS
jgi:CheY-like chemotaxis protein